MKSSIYKTITTDDVGIPYFKAFGRVLLCCNFIGRILPIDVDKRVYLVDGAILQVESSKQRDERMNVLVRE